jgi:hypothetical protein
MDHKTTVTFTNVRIITRVFFPESLDWVVPRLGEWITCGKWLDWWVVYAWRAGNCKVTISVSLVYRHAPGINPGSKEPTSLV